MAVPKTSRNISVEEYLTNEECATIRSEYIDGHVFAMSGVTARHNIIALNFYSLLRSHLKGGGCRAYVSDFKVKIKSANSFYYPDVMVSCDKIGNKTIYTENPILIAEVLSPATAAIDRREKLLAYRQIETLKEYVIVHQRKKQVQLHKRNKQQGWDVLEFGPDSEIVLESIPAGVLKIPVAAIYEDVPWQLDQDWQVREGSEDRDACLDEDALDW